jgi:hypothetical protein
MSKFELYSNKSATQFESHMQGLEQEIKKLLLDLRNFIKNLGSNVIGAVTRKIETSAPQRSN